jgi:hypothetical protein
MSIPAPKWMNPDAETLLREASKLPEGDRLRLADELRATLPASLSEAWTDEVVDRVEAYERGELETVDANEVFARIEVKYARR